MAVAPLFVTDMTTLKAALRLTGAAASDAVAMINQAVLDARLGFIRRLGLSRCDTIAAVTFDDSPDTELEVLKALAVSTEIKWVRLNLMRVLPTAFMDGSAPTQTWNQEAPFRSASRSDLSTEMQKLESEIGEALDLLEGEDAIADEKTINGTSIGPDCSKKVGNSIWRNLA